MIETFKKQWKLLWNTVRQVSGDDAYERYLKHQVAHHPEQTPLSRQDFFRQWQERKWDGVKRCC